MRFRFFLFLLVAVSPFAFSAAAQDRVLGLLPFSSGTNEMFFAKMETLQTTPACNTSGRFTMVSTNARYKQTFAALLAAYHAGTYVRVYGTGTCNNWSNSEDIAYVCFGDIQC